MMTTWGVPKLRRRRRVKNCMDTQLQPQGLPVSSSAETLARTLDELDQADKFLRRYRSPRAQRVLRIMGGLRMTVAFITIDGLFWGPVGQFVVVFTQILWLFAEAWAAGYSDEQLLAYVNALSVVVLGLQKAQGRVLTPEPPSTESP